MLTEAKYPLHSLKTAHAIGIHRLPVLYGNKPSLFTRHWDLWVSKGITGKGDKGWLPFLKGFNKLAVRITLVNPLNKLIIVVHRSEKHPMTISPNLSPIEIQGTLSSPLQWKTRKVTSFLILCEWETANNRGQLLWEIALHKPTGADDGDRLEALWSLHIPP